VSLMVNEFNMEDPKIIVALDFDNQLDVEKLLAKIDPSQCRVKVGKELFTLMGPKIVEIIQNLGFQIFLDLKFHDIPITVKKACKAAAGLGVWMLNVHALGGRDMLLAAKEGVVEAGSDAKLIAVTILTSSSVEDIHSIGLVGTVEENVLRLAAHARDAELDGVVCSAREAKIIRNIANESFSLVTPGIRPAGALLNDQKRVLTPKEAIESGANYLVVGRPITTARDPQQVIVSINTELMD